MAGRAAIETLVGLMDEAFRGAGIEEINHLRSILGPDDRWRFIQLGYG